MKFAILLTLFGLAVSSPLTWVYDYEADVGTFDSHNQEVMAGAKLVAKVQVTVPENKQSVNIKVSDVKTCRSVDDQHIPAGRTPILCTPQGDSKLAQIEKPFSVQFTSNGERLMVPKDDPLWVANMRKGIVATLRIPYVLQVPGLQQQAVSQNVVSSGIQTPTAFEKYEDTIHGRCLVRYTVTEEVSALPVRLLQDTQEFAQKEYKLIKSIDMSACDEPVWITKASQGNFSHTADDQFRRVSSRSSVGNFIVQGNPSSRLSTRVVKSVIEGTVVLNNLKTVDRSAIAITNQTLSLTRATQENLVSVSSTDLRPETWMFRVMSDHKKAQDSPSWISFLDKGEVNPMYPVKDLLGLPAASDPVIEQRIVTLLTKIASLLTKPNEIVPNPDSTVHTPMKTSTDQIVARDLREVVHLLRMVPKSVQKGIYNKLPTDTIRLLFVEAMRSTGTPASFQVILDLIKEHKLTSAAEMIAVFSPLNVGAFNPVMVSELIDWVIHNTPSDVSVKSAVLINLSTLVRRLCILRTEGDFIFPRAMFGAHQCTPKVDVYINFLKTKLEENKQSNKQHCVAIYMQALANVGNQKSVEALAKYAEGEVNIPTKVTYQLHAINGLTKNHMQNSSHVYVRNILLSIVEAEKYEPEVRQAAILSLFTLPQNASMWDRVAVNTWREPDLRVAGFIYSYFKSVAETENPHFLAHINAARSALKVARPFNLTMPDSQYYLFSKYDLKTDYGYNFEMALAMKDLSTTPSLLKGKFVSFVSGLKFPIVHGSDVGMSISSSTMEDAKTLFAGLLKQQLTRSPLYREAISRLDNNKNIQQIMHLSLLKDVEVLIPVTGDYIEELLLPQQSLVSQVFASLRNQEPTESVFFTKSTENFMFVPSDAGVPVLMEMDDIILTYHQQQSTIETESQLKQVHGQFMTKIARNSRTQIKVLVPWVFKEISAGFDTDLSVMIPPTDFTVSFDLSQSIAKLLTYEFSVPLSHRHEHPMVVTEFIPYLAIKEWVEVTPANNEVYIISKRPMTVHLPLVPAAMMNITGLIVGSDLDVFDIHSMWTWATDPIYSKEAWQIFINYTPDQHQAKKLAGKFIYASKPETASLQQVLGAEPIIPDLNIQDTVEQRIEKMTRSPAKKMFSASFEVEDAGASKKFEMINLWTAQRSQAASTKKLNHQIVMMQSGSPLQQVCVSSELKLPFIDLRGGVGSQIAREVAPVELTSQIYTGPVIQQSGHAMTMKATARMSQERRQLVGTSSVQPVYDELNVEIEKLKPVSPIVEKVISFGHYLLYPTLETPSLQSSPSMMAIIKASRSLYNDRMNIRMTSPSHISSMTGIRVPRLVDQFSVVLSQ